MPGQANTPLSYPMNSGDGPLSYSQNSTFQRMVVEAAKVVVKKAIQDTLEFTDPGFHGTSPTFSIADFGCSVGSNTLIATRNIIESVRLKYESQYQNSPPLEFQVFFNDVVNNDFNTLFRNLPVPRDFYAAGVPGGFHRRLFPKASLHLGHSSIALHWLSKLPEEVLDVNSPAWNKDSIYCSGRSKEVSKAFAAQFQNDMENFLDARAQELVGGGLLIFTVPGLPEGIICSQTHHGVNNDMLGQCLMDMAKEGIISKEKVEAFNLPVYYTPIKEMEAILQRNTDFSVEIIDTSLASDIWPPSRADPSIIKPVTLFMRSAFSETIIHHFGDKIIDSLFDRFARKVAEYIDSKSKMIKPVNIFVVLKRKIN